MSAISTVRCYVSGPSGITEATSGNPVLKYSIKKEFIFRKKKNNIWSKLHIFPVSDGAPKWEIFGDVSEIEDTI